MLILTLWLVCTGQGTRIAVALVWDLPVRVLEFIDIYIW